MVKSFNNIKNKTYFNCMIKNISNVIKFCYDGLISCIKIVISCIFITISYIIGFLYGCLSTIAEFNCYNNYNRDVAYGFKHGVDSIYIDI
jgi:hypothetical protein